MFALEVTRFPRNRGSQFLFLGNRAIGIGGSIREESRFTIPFLGKRATSSLLRARARSVQFCHPDSPFNFKEQSKSRKVSENFGASDSHD